MNTNLTTSEYIDKIMRIKADLGSRLVILTHHYQRKEIVDIGDHRGDSFALSQRAAQDENARYIVFCGVHFMAESAAILAKENQTVQIPDMNAGCWNSPGIHEFRCRHQSPLRPEPWSCMHLIQYPKRL